MSFLYDVSARRIILPLVVFTKISFINLLREEEVKLYFLANI